MHLRSNDSISLPSLVKISEIFARPASPTSSPGASREILPIPVPPPSNRNGGQADLDCILVLSCRESYRVWRTAGRPTAVSSSRGCSWWLEGTATPTVTLPTEGIPARASGTRGLESITTEWPGARRRVWPRPGPTSLWRRCAAPWWVSEASRTARTTSPPWRDSGASGTPGPRLTTSVCPSPGHTLAVLLSPT